MTEDGNGRLDCYTRKKKAMVDNVIFISLAPLPTLLLKGMDTVDVDKIGGFVLKTLF